MDDVLQSKNEFCGGVVRVDRGDLPHTAAKRYYVTACRNVSHEFYVFTFKRRLESSRRIETSIQRFEQRRMHPSSTTEIFTAKVWNVNHVFLLERRVNERRYYHKK